jgi:type I restriction enzyme S subunit
MNYNNKYPEYWEGIPLIKLVDVFETGARPKGGVRGIENGIPSLGGEHLDNNGKFKFEKIKYVPKEFALSMKKGIIHPQDILLVKDGATTGKVSYVNDSFPFKYAVINEHLFLIRCLDLINSKFIFYYLYSPVGQKDVQDNFKGSAQGGINHSFSKNTIIPLPPFNEQNRIVEILDALFAKIDNIKERMEIIPELIKQFRQSVLHAAVTGKLTEEWRKSKKIDSWRQTEFKEIVKQIQAGKNFSCPEIPVTDNGVGLVKISAVSWGEFDSYETKTVTDEKRIDPKLFIQTGDFLISRANTIELVGASVVVKDIKNKIMLSDKVWRVRFQEDIVPKFIDYFLKSSTGREEIESRATGNQQSMRNISQNAFKAININLPSKEEQQEIVVQVNMLFERISRIESKLVKIGSQLNELSQSLLIRAFKGELGSQDPDDEPADKLLERILQEKAKLINNGRKLRSDNYLLVADLL